MVATSRALAWPPAAAHGWLDRAACAMHRRMVGATLTAMAAVAASGVPLAAGGPSTWPVSHSEPRCSEDTGAPRRAHESVRVRARLRKVGWIFTQSTKARDFIISGAEAAQMAAVQAELGEAAVTAVVSLAPAEDGGSEAHFEAFQARAPPGRRAGRAAAHGMHHLYKVRRRMRTACRMRVRAWELGVRSRVGLGREGSEGRGSAARAHRAGVRPGGAALAGGLVPGGGGARRRAGAAQPQGAPRPAGHGLLCRRLRTSGARPSLPPGPPSGARWHRGGRQGQLRCCCAPRRRAAATLPPHDGPAPAAPQSVKRACTGRLRC